MAVFSKAAESGSLLWLQRSRRCRLKFSRSSRFVRWLAYARHKLVQFADDPIRINEIKDEIRAKISVMEGDQHSGHVSLERQDKGGVRSTDVK